MVKSDEIKFYAFLRSALARNETPRAAIGSPDCPVSHKRAWYLLNKWAGRGWYEYGVTLDLGWFTPAAPSCLGVTSPEKV